MLKTAILGHVLFFCSLSILVNSSSSAVVAKETHKVHCSENLMHVEIVIPDVVSNNNHNNKSVAETPKIFLEGLKDYPNDHCQPTITGNLAEFKLSLSNFYECGVTRMINQLTGKKVYYHKIIIETGNGKEIVSVKCIINGPIYNVMMNSSHPIMETHQQQQQQHHHGVVRRDVLPAGFQEAEDLEIATVVTKRAPEPHLSIGVSQNGKKVTGDLTVTPGTPLTMEISLDPESASVYGLGVNYLEVTDTRALSETIIFKGCTVDPYLFENFNTIDGDVLSAKFKAFKFPDSSYVQFRATVNVCIDKCLGTKCSNNQIGYGRRRRDVSPITPTTPLMDSNKVYEISLAMFIKINDVEGSNDNHILHIDEKLREMRLSNQRLARNNRENFEETMAAVHAAVNPAEQAYVFDKDSLSVPKETSSASRNAMSAVLVLLIAIIALCKY